MILKDYNRYMPNRYKEIADWNDGRDLEGLANVERWYSLVTAALQTLD